MGVMRRLIELDNVLVLSPHYDDGVLGCGGTIAKLVELGVGSVKYFVFSPSSPGYKHETLRPELERAIILLGLNSSDVEYLDFETREFPRDRQRILDTIYDISGKMDTQAIFTPTRFDVHQDHQTITNELLRVYKRKPTSIFGYELVLNTFSFETTVFCGLEENHMEAKLNAFDCFKTQMSRLHFSRQLFESTARVRGAQMGTKFAEAYEAIKVVL